ncbi:MFS transporter [Streptomyces sp. S.PB5]|uniref:MFS transporter n=1 Tax=Streptomyces sp. S.PB5 TaxID=3020844 RepID=UPI0025AEF26E|nr:MFS transporter [Streptomyces sp. S.PB5]MDN3021679.1 MFS transporter [Streptomyces sp. S.PB5]
MGTMGRAYREVVDLTGPLLPVMSFLGRLPTATIQFGSVLLVARTSDSLTAAGLTGGALALGQVACGPLVGRLADRHGQRTVVLCFALANALAVTALVAGALAGLPAPALALLGTTAGATVPLIGPLARARLVSLARRAGAPDGTVATALSFESTLDEISFVLGPALVGVAAVVAHPAYAMGGAAVLVAVCGSGFALHPTATTGATGVVPSPTRGARPRMPRAVHALRVALALQGAVFGACQAGITALTDRLGQGDQAGLVYAAMGVTSAVAGLSMAAVPARIPLTTRWRLATAAAFALLLPLLWTDGLIALYAVVTALGLACAPHLITVFGLTERAVPQARLAEAMAFATSALVGGQALAIAGTGRLAEAYGPAAAFGAGILAAALACALALTARPTSYARSTEGGEGGQVTQSAQDARGAEVAEGTPHARVPSGGS